MKIKTLVPAALLMLAAFSTRAQEKTTFGVRGGVNFQNLNGKDIDGNKLDNKLKTGFNIGVNAEVPVAKEFYLQPGVLFTTKGAKTGDNQTTSISYIEVPVNFLYKPALGNGKLLLGFGPYVAFGVGGKVKRDNASDVDVKFKNTISVSDLEDPYFRRFDAGGNLLAGYEFNNKLSFQINAQLGLAKINPEINNFPADQSSVKNTGFGVSAGYRF